MSQKETTLDVSFGELLRAALDERDTLRKRVDPDVFSVDPRGVSVLKLPVADGEQFAIDATDGARPVQSVGPVTWLDDGAPLLGLVRRAFVSARKGHIPIGGSVPDAAIVAELSARGTVDPPQTTAAYELTRYAQAATDTTTQSLLQATDDLLDALLEANQIALSERLQAAILGDVHATVSATPANVTTYQAADAGNATGFITAESAAEDSAARGDALTWFLGTSLSTAARLTVSDAGSGRATEEERRLVQTGVPAHRSSDVPADVGIVSDWRRSVVLVTTDYLEITIDRITRPGSALITTRQGFDVVLARAALVRVLTQA